MAAIRTEDLFYPAIVSLFAALQLARFTRRVGEARGRYKIPVPKTDGDPNFTRIFRAQQNNLEFYPIFMTLLWTSSIFLHPAFSSFFGLIYLCARHKYFYGYSQASQERLPGLRLAVNILMILLILSIVGMASTGYTKYTGKEIDVSFYQEKALEFAKPAVDRADATYKWIHKASSPYVKVAGDRVRRAIEGVTDAATRMAKCLQTYARAAYVQAYNFLGKAYRTISEASSLLADYFSSFKNKYISRYFQKRAKQEL